MITTLVSYLSHSQIWALQEGIWLHVGGTTNRATLMFGNEFEEMLSEVPDLKQPQAVAKQQPQSQQQGALGNGNDAGANMNGNGRQIDSKAVETERTGISS
jgi:hypothetical protein